MNYPTIPYEEIDAVVGGYHGDPFSILGPHKYEDGVIVRAFLPLAEDAEVMISSFGSQIHHLPEVHLNAIVRCVMKVGDIQLVILNTTFYLGAFHD